MLRECQLPARVSGVGALCRGGQAHLGGSRRNGNRTDRGIGWAFDENYDEKVVSGMWCCRHGTQVKPKLPDLPPEFVEIFTRLLLVKNKNGEERRPYFDRLSRYVNNQFAFSALGIDDGEQAQRRQTAEISGGRSLCTVPRWWSGLLETLHSALPCTYIGFKTH